MDLAEKVLRGLNQCLSEDGHCGTCPYDPDVCQRRPTHYLTDIMIDDIKKALDLSLRNRSRIDQVDRQLERIAAYLADYCWPPETDLDSKMTNAQRRAKWITVLRDL